MSKKPQPKATRRSQLTALAKWAAGTIVGVR